jgi:hypothetical protein
METKRHQVNLNQYRKVGRKRQSTAVAGDARGMADPRMIRLGGRSAQRAARFFAFNEDGKAQPDTGRTDAGLLGMGGGAISGSAKAGSFAAAGLYLCRLAPDVWTLFVQEV